MNNTLGGVMLKINTITDLQAGVAGEHLVCAHLLLLGYNAFLTDQNCPYDLAVEMGGRLIRIQVKSTRKPKPVPQRVKSRDAYLWHVKRAGKGGKRHYRENDFDVLALVALDTARIAFCSPSKVKNCIIIRSDDTTHNKGYSFNDFTFEIACKRIREAYAQPDIFIELEKKEVKQEKLFINR